jgi:P2 family phage major capsid protein
MRNETRLAFNALSQRIAQINGVPLATEKFSVTPSVQQTLETKLQLSSAFLGKINIIGVTEQSGEKLKLGTTGTIAGRTNTTVADRTPADPTDLYNSNYTCKQTNFDTAIKYAKLDAWAKFPAFQTRYRDVCIKQQALDRMMIGFNGTSAAVATDRAANPLLQDVNIGWLQHIRTDAAAHVMAEVVAASGVVNVGEGWDYENIDALVMDVTENLIDEAARDNPGLVVICGRSILADKYFSKVNRKQGGADELASDIIVSQKQIGGLEAVRVPFFPSDAILVTTLDNLSIYFQDGARRQQLLDNPKRDQIENYESSNDAYVVEDYGIVALVENIVIKTAPKP